MENCATAAVSALLLVPTRFELARLGGARAISGADLRVELCGFGPIAAAARCAELAKRFAPRLVILAGIAGSYDLDAFPLGDARVFSCVAIDGMERNEKFPQWESPGGDAIRDRLTCRTDAPPRAAEPEVEPELVTVMKPTRDSSQAAERRARFRGALAEDMEGFGVAIACALCGVPLRIVRGASNAVGDHDQKRWRADAALAAVARDVESTLRIELGGAR